MPTTTTDIHPPVGLDAVLAGEARVIICPDCGQMEIWTNEELNDHGHCRSDPTPCPECQELTEWLAETHRIAERELAISLAEDAADAAGAKADEDAFWAAQASRTAP